MGRALLLLSCLAVAGGCRPPLGAPASLVNRTTLLAVRGEPAEAAPGAQVTFDALVVTPGGTVQLPALQWAFCTAPKPLTQNNAVSDSCLADAVTSLGAPGPEVSAALPSDACSLFGPDVPPVAAGSPPLRPRDPDITGGYYQPVRAELDGLIAFGLQRIQCNLGSAPVDVALDYKARYVPNRNPTLTPLTASVNGQPVALEHIPPGVHVQLQTGWTQDSVETFLVFDLATQALVEHRESMRVSWFLTAGSLASDRTGIAEGDEATVTTDDWEAPRAPGTVYLWVVLRDSRGGVDFAGYSLKVDSP